MIILQISLLLSCRTYWKKSWSKQITKPRRRPPSFWHGTWRARPLRLCSCCRPRSTWFLVKVPSTGQPNDEGGSHFAVIYLKWFVIIFSGSCPWFGEEDSLLESHKEFFIPPAFQLTEQKSEDIYHDHSSQLLPAGQQNFVPSAWERRVAETYLSWRGRNPTTKDVPKVSRAAKHSKLDWRFPGWYDCECQGHGAKGEPEVDWCRYSCISKDILPTAT